MPSYYNWNYTMPSLGPNGELTGGPDPYADQADPSKGTDIRWSDDSWQHLDPHLDRNGNYDNPTVFMSDSLPGGHAAAFPDTDEYGHIGRVFRTDRNRSIGKMLAIIGGGALAAGMGAGAGTAGGVGDIGSEGYGISEGFLGGAPEGLGSGLGSIAPEVADVMTVTAPALGALTPLEMAGVAGGATAGAGALSSIGSSPSGLPTGDVGSSSPEAYQASGEYAPPNPSSPPGVFSKLGSMAKGAFVNPDGSYNWGNIIKAGGTALGAVGAYHNSQNPGTPQLPAGWNDHLAPTPLNRHVVGLGNDDAYRTYGQTGGEHQFFQPGPVGPSGPATSSPGGPNVHLNDPIDFTREPVMRSGGHYIKGAGTGRSDEIDAKLSNDEYVMDAETVALLGDGSPEAGAKKLDQLRANIRMHKGKQLAKGKFSANAKDPAEYLPMRKAKGGVVKFARGGAVQLRSAAAEERFRSAIGSTMPVKKAGGGAVKAMNAFAADLEQQVNSGNSARAAQIKTQMDGLSPGAGRYFEEGFAKGGKVKNLVESFGKFFDPPIEHTMPPKRALTPEQMAYMVQWLRQNNPTSDALKHFENASTPDLRGRVPGAPSASAPEDVMKILGQE